MKIITGFLIIILLVSVSFARKKDDSARALKRTEKAISTLKSFSALKKDSVPAEVFRKAKAVGIFSDVKLHIHETIARGVISVRNGEKWSTPLFATLGSLGVSFMPAINETYNFVFFVMDEESVESLKKGKINLKVKPGWFFNGNSAALGTKEAPVIYYVFSDEKLLTRSRINIFSGTSSLISLDNDSNKEFYKQTGQIILTNAPSSLPILPSAERFHQTLGELFSSSN